MKKLFFLCLFSFYVLGLSAQDIRGRVVNEANEPMPYVNAVLLQLPDSTFVAGAVTDDEGVFNLRQTAPNQMLSLSFVGYHTSFVELHQSDLGDIQLQPDAQLVGEVVIKGYLPVTKVKHDATITTVAGSILEKAGTGNDLLNKIPGLSATDGKVNVFGSGDAEIYINGRKMRDEAELDLLQSENVKSIEVVRNPGAGYAASVKSVVRITTKKPLGEGFGLSNRFFTSYFTRWRIGDQISMNYRKKGLDVGVNLFAEYREYVENKELEQKTYLEDLFQQNSTYHDDQNKKQYSANIILNYQFNDRHSLGGYYHFWRLPHYEAKYWMLTDMFQNGSLTEKSLNKTLDDNTSVISHSANVYYVGKIKDWQINFNADLVWDNHDNYSKKLDQITTQDNQSDERFVTVNSRVNNKLYATKLVVEHPLFDGHLSFGSEYSYSDRLDGFSNEEQLLEGTENTIREQSLSAFMQYNRSFGRLATSLGLRYEHLNSDYYVRSIKQNDQSRVYDHFFPSVALSLGLKDVNLQLNYSVGIERPSYGQLTSEVQYGNKYTYTAGNPYLRPMIFNKLLFGVSYKWLYFNVNYTHKKDLHIQDIRPYSDLEPNIALLTWINAPKGDCLDMMLSLAPSCGVWSPQFNMMYSQKWLATATPFGRNDFSNPLGIFQWNNTFNLPKDFQFGVNFSLMTPGEEQALKLLRTCGSVDCFVYKGFFKNRLSLQFKVSDLFETDDQYVKLYSTSNTIYVKNFKNRMFELTVRYKFNPARSKYRGTGAGESQKQRM